MLFKSQLITQASGSIGGITASRNRGGMYFRSRAIPTDPATAFQIAIRAFMVTAVGAWSGTLTQLERDDWEVYASLVTLPGPLGDPITVSGMNMYVRVAVLRLQNGLPQNSAAPTIFNLGDTGAVSFTALALGNALSITFDDTTDWANQDDGALVLQVSRPQNPTINFFKGPFRKIDPVLGDSTTPPTSPAAGTSPFTLSVGQRVWMRVCAVHEDGRLSAASVLGPVVVG